MPGANSVVIFDGPNKIIREIAAGALNEIDAIEVYSESKVWVQGNLFFDAQADVNGTTERLAIPAHSLYTGQAVFYTADGGVENMGLTDETYYYVRVIDDDTLEIYDTKANAEGDPSTTGRQNLTPAASPETHRLNADNAKFLQPISAIGGDPITLTEFVGATFFLENGWRFRPAESSHKLTVVGNIFTREPGQSAFVDTVGAFTVNAETRVSNLVTTIATGSGLSPTEQTRLAEIWQRLGLDINEKVTYTDTGIVVGSITLTISEPNVSTTEVQRS